MINRDKHSDKSMDQSELDAQTTERETMQFVPTAGKRATCGKRGKACAGPLKRGKYTTGFKRAKKQILKACHEL